jgi:hypothetical protein
MNSELQYYAESELHYYAESGDLEGVMQLVESGANIEEVNKDNETALLLAIQKGRFKIVVYLVDNGANVAHRDNKGWTALHCAIACDSGSEGCLQLLQYLHPLKGGASITDTDNVGCTALLRAAMNFKPELIQWLLEYGAARITDTDNRGASVWTGGWNFCLPAKLIDAYETDAFTKDGKGEFVSIDGQFVPNGDTVAIVSMLRVMVLHGGPPEALIVKLAPPLQRIVHDGARLRARLPAYLVQRRALLDAHCPLLPPLLDLVLGYEEPTTTDELWATGLGDPL